MDGLLGIGFNRAVETNSAAKPKEMGRDEFLKMFLAQMRHQDPLNPLEGQEMASQLAQFSSLEQLTKMNGTLQSMKASQDDASRLQALDFIGKEIVAGGNALFLEQGKVTQGRFELGTSAQCSALIRNQVGITVKTIPLGALSPGSHTFLWDGRDNSGKVLPPGTYTFEVQGQTAAGRVVRGDPRVSGKVTGVNLESGNVLLKIGEVPVGISEVMSIVMPKAEEGQGGSGVSDSGFEI